MTTQHTKHFPESQPSTPWTTRPRHGPATQNRPGSRQPRQPIGREKILRWELTPRQTPKLTHKQVNHWPEPHCHIDVWSLGMSRDPTHPRAVTHPDAVGKVKKPTRSAESIHDPRTVAATYPCDTTINLLPFGVRGVRKLVSALGFFPEWASH